MTYAEAGQTMTIVRDTAAERRERARYSVLRELFARVGDDCSRALPGLSLGAKAALPPEETYRAIEYLAHHEYVSYQAGPSIAMTAKGLRYLAQEAGRRRSIRDRTSRMHPR